MWSAYRHGLNVTKLHCYIVTWHCNPEPRKRRKVIFEARFLRNRGLEILASLR